mmetsp:Transcript_11947/g.25230  ORF Transcript_11947/g.25230 Transcript_11947/m.25230 type:complete len:88 (-) Transcript_11947:14-277(-)
MVSSFLFTVRRRKLLLPKLCHVMVFLPELRTSLDVTNADGSRSRIHFKYPEPISCHNQAKHWVDDTNIRQHDPIAISDVWRTKWWPN